MVAVIFKCCEKLERRHDAVRLHTQETCRLVPRNALFIAVHEVDGHFPDGFAKRFEAGKIGDLREVGTIPRTASAKEKIVHIRKRHTALCLIAKKPLDIVHDFQLFSSPPPAVTSNQIDSASSASTTALLCP